jgi:hypothetical protein
MQFYLNFIELTGINFFSHRISYNIFILYYYDGTIIHDVDNNITYNGRSNVLLKVNLGMSLILNKIYIMDLE